MNQQLSIMENLNVTNEDIIVTYTPLNSVAHFSYSVFKDSNIVLSETIYNNKPIDIILNETGEYYIEINNYDYYTNQSKIVSGKYLIDKTAPRLELTEDSIIYSKNIDLNSIISATDNYDGNITNNITNNISELDISESGIKKLTYTVSDAAGNISYSSVDLIIPKSKSTFPYNFVILLLIISLICILTKIFTSYKAEKRISKFSVNSIKDNSFSIFDKINKDYKLFIKKISRLLSKSEILKKHGKRYQKYIDVFYEESNIFEFFANKICIGLGFIIISSFIKLFKFELLNYYEMLISFIVGFYVFDLINFYKYKIYRKNLENDMLQAIIIMNNSFKSGMSIVQAIDMVGNQLNGAIAIEFSKMSLELSYGLELEEVFRRFSNRVNIEEAVYLTSSLSVINKTGGNIIKVFNSIEKTLFNRKKLRLELKSLTGSSRLIMRMLIIVPILFIAVVSLVNKDYFTPLFTSSLGYIIIFIIIILYVLYIFVVRKIMNVRM